MRLNFGSSLPEHLSEESGGADFVLDADCEVTECVLLHGFDLTASPDLVVDAVSVSLPISKFSFCASQTLALSEKAVPLARWCVDKQKRQA